MVVLERIAALFSDLEGQRDWYCMRRISSQCSQCVTQAGQGPSGCCAG